MVSAGRYYVAELLTTVKKEVNPHEKIEKLAGIKC